jgi:hypothetical protein
MSEPSEKPPPTQPSPPHEVVSSVLTFYSSELTSHGAMIVGFVVAFFALVESRVALPHWFFVAAAIGIVSIETYLLLGVVMYASLSDIVMSVSMKDYVDFLAPNHDLLDLLDHARVVRFAGSRLEILGLRGSLFKARFRQKEGRRVSLWVQPRMIVSTIVGVVTILLMFGFSIDWTVVTLLIFLGVSLAEGLSR